MFKTIYPSGRLSQDFQDMSEIEGCIEPSHTVLFSIHTYINMPIIKFINSAQ